MNRIPSIAVLLALAGCASTTPVNLQSVATDISLISTSFNTAPEDSRP